MKHIVAAILGIFILSFLFGGVGDLFLERDQIREAHMWYGFSRLLNPFSNTIAVRIAIAQVLTEERKGESEETNIEEDRVAINKNASAVLGISTTVPVLMYHYIRVNPYADDRVGFNLSVTPANFDAQMQYLATHQFHTITLDELEKALVHGAKLPDKPIVITLDDGYRDSYTFAFPILKSHHLRAVNFIITGFVGGPRYLTWDQINEMEKSGTFTFGSHTVNHISLPAADKSRARQELLQSKSELESHLGHSVYWFAYPYGNVNESVVRLTAQAGYHGAFGTNHGTYQSSDHMFTLPRIRIGGSDTVSSFAAKLPWK